MMHKRVHFAPTNLVFSSRTPSPTLSDSSSRPEEDSSSDSSLVSTPPPEHYHCPQSLAHETAQTYYNNPHGVLFLVPKSPPRRMNIHLLLAFHPDTDIPLRYDLSSGFIMSHVASEDLATAATEPPLASLLILCPYLAWEIHVAPAPFLASSPDGGVFGGQRDYVTVYDVLRCLHRSLRQVVTPEEYDALAPIGLSRNAVDSAYHSRIAKTDDLVKRTRDEKYGVRRIDFLQGFNVFRGLAGTLVGPNVWELNVAPVTMGTRMVAPVMAIAASTASTVWITPSVPVLVFGLWSSSKVTFPPLIRATLAFLGNRSVMQCWTTSHPLFSSLPLASPSFFACAHPFLRSRTPIYRHTRSHRLFALSCIRSTRLSLHVQLCRDIIIVIRALSSVYFVSSLLLYHLVDVIVSAPAPC